MDALPLLEYAANIFFVLSVFLAARNNVHTWWTGITGSTLFSILFYHVQLYAEVTLMLFFVATSVYGWRQWSPTGANKPIARSRASYLALLTLAALVTTAVYAALLQKFTDAFAPAVDSAVLMFSVLAQFLLMHRRIETWWFWLVVDTIAVPLYFSRELYLTGAVYAVFWLNAMYGYNCWQKRLRLSCPSVTSAA